VFPAARFTVVLNGTSSFTAVTFELKTTTLLITTPTTTPMLYWAPRNWLTIEYMPVAGAVNTRSEYCPPIPDKSRNSSFRKLIFPSSRAGRLLYSAEGKKPLVIDDDDDCQSWAVGPLGLSCVV
jgi:hypothetical protein